MVKVGDKAPSAAVKGVDFSDIKTDELFAGKKVVLFAVPGAFTPTCSKEHAPGFIKSAKELKAKGADLIACISVNDSFVMKAWADDLGAGEELTFLADGNGDFTKAMGLELDGKGFGLGSRSQRYAAVIEDGVIKALNVEPGGGLSCSSAESVLSLLQASSQAPPTRPRARTALRAAAAAAPPGAPIVVAGAGIGGLAAALALHRVGLTPLVLERAPELRGGGAAIALWANAWRALDALGVAEELRAASPQTLDRFELVRADGRLLRGFRLDECDAAAGGGEAGEFRGTRRGALLEALAGALPAGCVRLGCGVAAVEGERAGGPAVRLTDGSVLECSLLIGADGANSVVARHLGLPDANYAGYTAYRGVATFPPGKLLPVPPSSVRQLYGAGVRAGMYPLSENEVYWFTCFNEAENAPAPATPEAQLEDALSRVAGWRGGIEEAVRRTPAGTLQRNRIRDRWTLGAFGRGRVTLAGDAAHPMTPNLGQGGCAALEDAVVLARELKGAYEVDGSGGGGAAEAALRRYEDQRWRRALPLTVRSWAFGAALQLPFPPVLAARDAFMARAFSPAHFLDHTAFDVGVLV
ncbi:MAG: hypothetical protein J3K34DRAFT_518475 [Monoraphidium minutum]|nr:MAG: hypothetical protein J3K34DRAFT_518475 [Monoraphidium minutum]